MEIVINKCYGGFSLSHDAVMALARSKGINLYAFADATGKDGRIQFGTMVPYVGQKAFFIYYSTEPLGADGHIPAAAYWSDRDVAREDPELISIVKKLGQSANGACADLAIVEIPDGTDYEIEQYDGAEWISEKHRTWS